MNKLATLVVLSIYTFACLAQPAGKNFPFPRMNVERLQTLITPAPKDPTKDLAKRKALANIGFTYVDGVIDATEGTEWCFTGKQPLPEIDSDIKILIDKTPPTAGEKNAAKLIIDYLRTNHPCQKTK